MSDNNAVGMRWGHSSTGVRVTKTPAAGGDTAERRSWCWEAGIALLPDAGGGGWGGMRDCLTLSLSFSGELVHYRSLFPECNQSVSRLNQSPTDLWPEPCQSLLLLPAVHINQVNIHNLISGQSGFSSSAVDSVPHCWRCRDGGVVAGPARCRPHWWYSNSCTFSQ